MAKSKRSRACASLAGSWAGTVGRPGTPFTRLCCAGGGLGRVIPWLSAFPKLRVLSLSGSGATDAGLGGLLGLKALEFLRLDGSRDDGRPGLSKLRGCHACEACR